MGIALSTATNLLPQEIQDDPTEETLLPGVEIERAVATVESLPKDKYLKFCDTLQKQYLAFVLKICEQFFCFKLQLPALLMRRKQF